jgi:hypothetical protein
MLLQHEIKAAQYLFKRRGAKFAAAYLRMCGWSEATALVVCGVRRT